jgi:pentatricopeptide repeat protein
MPATMPAIDIITEVWTLVVAARLELMTFFAAMAMYAVLNMYRMPKSASKKFKVKVAHAEESDKLINVSPSGRPCKSTFNSAADVEVSLHAAINSDEHSVVLQCWEAAKQFDLPAAVAHFPKVAASMQRCKKDSAFISRELRMVFNKYPNHCNISLINDLLEPLSHRFDTQLMERIVQELPAFGLTKNAKTYEILLAAQLSMRNCEGVKTLAAEMRDNGTPFTARALVVIIKVALRTSDFEGAVQCFRELKANWSNKGESAESPPQAPCHIVSQLVDLACKEHQLQRFLPELKGAPITEEAVNTMLAECSHLRDVESARSVEVLAREQGAPLSDATYALILKAVADDQEHAKVIVHEAIAHNRKECSPDLVLAVLGFCSKSADVSLADQIFKQLKPHCFKTLSAFIRFYLSAGRYDTACDIYEQDVQAQSTSDSSARAGMVDARMERSLLNAALRCGRTALANTLLAVSPSDVAKHISMIQNCASEKNLAGAINVFESLKRSGVDLNSVVYNTVLDACVQCTDFVAVEEWMEKTKKAGMADVVSYNTIIKAYLLDGRPTKARSVMDEMKKLDLQPNRVTYNELINSIIASRGRKDEIWEIVREMKEAGIKPNQVTCSILLKTLNARSSDADVTLTMDLMNTMEEQMDEVLLSSVVEACVRIGKTELLASKLGELQGSSKIAVNGAHTFGSLIKAYGHARDVDGIWRCWQEMRSRHIKPSSITLGCMVEAVVNNGDPEGAYDLIQHIQDDEQCRGIVNSVIYCSVLKGFTREKKLDRVKAIYEEMSKRRIEMSAVMFNTIIDCCARVGRMESVAALLEDMKTHCVKPNLITYSTMIKGYCQSGDIQSAFSLLEQMRHETSLKPDEIMYNSLLDGCAQHSLVDEGLRLLEEMQAQGVQPTNFTLSVLVKLMNRARKIDKAFDVVRKISQKYNFKLNVHVYTNLIQACISSRQLTRAMDTLQTMIENDVQPEGRTFTLLVRGSMSNNHAAQAVKLLRGALGLPEAHPLVSKTRPVLLDNSLVNEVLNGLVDCGSRQSLAVPLLKDIQAGRQKVNVDASIQRRVMSASMSEDKPWSCNSAKGKGRGPRNNVH